MTTSTQEIRCQRCQRALTASARGTYECCGMVWHADSEDWMFDMGTAQERVETEEALFAQRKRRDLK